MSIRDKAPRSHTASATIRQALGCWLKTVTALLPIWDKRLELPGTVVHACHPSKLRLHSELQRRNFQKDNLEFLLHKCSYQKSFDGPLHVSPWPRGTDSTGQLSTGSSSQHGCVQIKPNPLLSAADPVTKNPRVRGQNCKTSSVIVTHRNSPHRLMAPNSVPGAGTILGSCETWGRQALAEQVGQ